MSVERIEQVSDEIEAALHQLMPQLTERPAPTRAELQQILESETGTLWVARNRSGLIVGMLTLAIYRTPTGIHAWIEDVVVDQQARGQGYGRQMTATAIDYASKKGAKAVNLTSRPFREAANKLYQKLGFELVETNLYRYYLEK